MDIHSYIKIVKNFNKGVVMKKYILPILLGVSFISANAADSDLRAEIEELKKQVAKLQKAQKKINIKSLKRQISEIKAHDGNDNIKWSVDFRNAYDIIGYKRANGDRDWNQIFTNRLWLKMAFTPADKLVFKGLLSYYKMYGASGNNAQRTGMQSFGKFDTFDWFVSEVPLDNTLRVKEAYWIYLGDGFLEAMFLGRQVSVEDRQQTDFWQITEKIKKQNLLTGISSIPNLTVQVSNLNLKMRLIFRVSLLNFV